MENHVKTLVAGNVRGKYSKLFKRVSDVNIKAGPFDLLFCIGDFFGDDINAYKELISGSTELPNVTTYVLGKIPKQLLEFHPNVDNFDQGCELVDGITFLGRSGILTTSLGLKIAYLNGAYSSDESKEDENIEFFNKKHYDSLIMSYQSSTSSIIDMLLTVQWPKNVFNYVSTDFDENIIKGIDQTSSSMVSQLCNSLRPRYHFVGGVNLFYERPPFRNHKVLNEQSRNVTRFISMADVLNSKKMKWLYAFNIVPSKYLSKQELIAQPAGVTENPFSRSLQEEEESATSAPSLHSGQFFYDFDPNDNSTGDDNNSRRKRENKFDKKQPRKQMKVDLENCWFCLASPNVDKTLIVSIGDSSYLALAKGGLTNDHLMILPIEHIRSTVEIEDHQLSEELSKFKTSLIDFFKQRNMVPVFFERNFRSAHFQIQVIGLPESKAPSLKQAVSEVFRNLDLHELSPSSELSDVVSPGIPYFYLDCPGHYKFFVRINTKKEFFPIQIGRELLAHSSLLDCADRIDWKRCTSDADEAKELTKTIRNDFKPFDFTL